MFAKIALFGGIIALIVALLYYLVRQGLFLRNTAIPQGNTFSLADIEDNLHESNLHSFLAQAEANGDYRLAVRLYYLNILKNMSLREYIIWKKDKTNTQYLADPSKMPPRLRPIFGALATFSSAFGTPIFN